MLNDGRCSRLAQAVAARVGAVGEPVRVDALKTATRVGAGAPGST